MMTSTQIRQSFLDFFKSKQHSIVPSSSLMPDSPNLLFTNAGMNQFVPIFLGQTKCPYTPGRAADTQKCIRAGGKHNDLDDVGLDTYHHTFFEMLGNWSFGDYFKKEAIDWAWELVIQVWKFPPQRLYATVYNPDKSKNDPSDFDQEAWDFWAEKFRSVGLDPAVHIVNGNKKDNFWMMGETGPCGPCSELHVDLTPAGDTRGALVNKGSAECIEIWNLVFIQFNANPDGTFSPLPAKHVDTGMGFERVTSIMQGTKGLTDFANAKISNYETDIFRPIFDALEKLSGRKYGSTLPRSGSTGDTEQEKVDVSFRVIADHIRTLSFAIADGIQPGNTDRNYVLRRILRRAVRYGRTLGFREPFFYKLVDVLADTMGDVFPEIRTRKKQVQDTIRVEEEAFNRTLDNGIALFNEEVEKLCGGITGPGGTGHWPVAAGDAPAAPGARYSKRNLPHFEKPWAIYVINFQTFGGRQLSPAARDIVFDCILHWRESRYRLTAACVMPDHVHMIIQPGIKEETPQGEPVFWPLSEILHSIKSFSAKEVNKLEHAKGVLWQEERFDRYIRSDSDLQEKFRYVCANPWAAGVVDEQTPYRWLWTQDIEAAQPYVAPASLPYASTAGQVARQNGPVARSTQTDARISGAFAFRLYDEQGFPLDLTELMARERGLTVDKEGFEKLMEEQRARARAAQKKEVISLSQIETTTPTQFVGYDNLAVSAKVVEVVALKDKTAVILDTSVCYAEMGGQVGDTGELTGGGNLWRISNTQKSGNTFLHFIETESAEPAAGDAASRGAHAPSRVSDRAPAVGTDARPRASSGTTEPKYSRRNLPHFERPWAKYMVTFSTRERRNLTPPERDLVLKSVLYAHDHRQYQLYAACVMPDHVHLLIEPQIKEEDKAGRSVFWSLSEILQGIKSASAHNINKLLGQSGHVWEQESMDRMLRGQSDLEEKFHYICRNPWDAGIVDATENYKWLWTPDAEGSRAVARVGAADEASAATAEAAVLPTRDARGVPAHEIALPVAGSIVTLSVDHARRNAIQRHHTVTHLLHWALHEVVSKEASQKGSFVGPDKLTFDFNSAALTPAQVADIEKLVNERILENSRVGWVEVPYADVKSRKDVMQFFGDKYGDTVRVVQIGGHIDGNGRPALDGYSMELCGGTHTRATGEIGLFRIVGENAIAAGVRRIEAVAGLTAYDLMRLDRELIRTVAGKVSAPVHELDKKVEALLAQQKELEKQLKAAQQREASNAASELLERIHTVNGTPAIIHNVGGVDGDFLQAVADSLKGRFKGVIVLGGAANGAVALIAAVSPDFTAKFQAGKIIQAIAPIVGGKGGGKPDNARGGGKDAGKLDEALARAKGLLG